MSVSLQNVNFHYPDTPKNQVLSIDKWEVYPGEKLFIYGPSGCGKSTLLNLISGILLPSSGSINVLGESLEAMTDHQRNRFRANNIGYIFQNFNLIPYLNSVENIRLAHYFSSKNKPSNTTALVKKIHNLLEALNMPIESWHKPINLLSIGQQQRVAIARALINNPKLLIADEPTSSLDPYNKENFMSLLIKLCTTQKITVLFVSHDQQLNQYFTRSAALPSINKIVNKQ